MYLLTCWSFGLSSSLDSVLVISEDEDPQVGLPLQNSKASESSRAGEAEKPIGVKCSSYDDVI